MSLSARQRGFTLLELIISIAIFALMAAMAYGGLDAVLRASHSVSMQDEDLRQLQLAMNRIERDLLQITPRSTRDGFGDTQAPLKAGTEPGEVLRFTRSGWLNPVGQVRSDLQRVYYRLQDEQLIRGYWQQLDRSPDSPFFETVLLSKLDSFGIRFLESEETWSEAWPKDEEQPNILPSAIEVRFEHQQFGEIYRLIPLVK